MKTYVIVDVESNGPIPGDYSMTSLGAVALVGESLKEFYINIKPISKKEDPERKKFVNSENAVEAKVAMKLFKEWLNSLNAQKLVFASDNNGYDWMFVCWYFWHFLNENPFGYYSENIQSILRGFKKSMKSKVSDLRERELTHNALEDSKDNAKVFLEMINKFQES